MKIAIPDNHGDVNQIFIRIMSEIFIKKVFSLIMRYIISIRRTKWIHTAVLWP